MKIVIDIPEEDYEKIKKAYACIFGDIYYIMQSAVANGTPLPKGHGRLIDADKELAGLKEMKVVGEADKQSVRFAILEFEHAKPIIEADAESEDKE